MLFFRYLCFLLMPLVALAIPAPDALADLKNALQARQDTAAASSDGGLGGLIGDLLGSIGGIGDLLNPDTFKELEIILRNAAWLLDDDGVKRTKNLITNANNLLTPTFVKSVGGLINAVAPLINTVVQLISGIISTLFG